MSKKRVIVIGEIGVNHNGNIDTAKKLIRVAKKAGCDFVKFQSFIAKNLVKKKTGMVEYQKNNLKKTNLKQVDMLKKYELSVQDHIKLIDYCKTQKIKFLSSPFDTDSLKILFNLGVKNIKIASGEITHYPLLRDIAKKATQVFLSTGMSTLKEIKIAVKILTNNRLKKKDLFILHCHSDYPTKLRDVNLNALKSIKNLLNTEVGYSDHTLGSETAISAVAMGARVIEKHITLDKKMTGPDHLASTEPKDFFNFVKSIRKTEELLGSGEKKPTKLELKTRKIVRKSIVAKFEIKKGEKFCEKNIISKRPEGGISPLKWKKIIGKRSKYNFKKDDFIKL